MPSGPANIAGWTHGLTRTVGARCTSPTVVPPRFGMRGDGTLPGNIRSALQDNCRGGHEHLVAW